MAKISGKNESSNSSGKDEFALATLIDAFEKCGKLPQLAFLLAQDNDGRLRALEKIVDSIYDNISTNRHIIHTETEDQITIIIVIALNAFGIDASHDSQVGGHVDILVKAAGGFVWIAEAKMDRGNSWISKGYLQLTTRYMPGTNGADSGELLIYCKKQQAIRTLQSWRSHLERQSNIELVEEFDVDGLMFRTHHYSEVSGRRTKVRHRVLPLYFNPQ